LPELNDSQVKSFLSRDLMKQIKTAIIGFGLSGKIFHARILRSLPQFHITSVVSSRAAEVQEELPEVSVFSSVQEVLTDKSIELVIIATPNQEHARFALEALAAGKHVVVEKPFAISSSEARQVVESAATMKGVLSVFHNRRWDNGFLTLKRELLAGTLGNIFQYEAHFDRFRPHVNHSRWREQAGEGSGILYDLGSHLIDQALHLFGRPQHLYCEMRAQRREAATDDCFTILLDYGSLQVTLGAGSIVGVPRPVLQVHGDRGSFIKYALDPQEEALRANKHPGNVDEVWGLDGDSAQLHQINSVGAMRQVECATIPGAYHDFYRGIFQAITEGTPAPVSPIDGLTVIELIEACAASAKQGSRITLRNP
jgi:scyllo-inositol 2-dehydrogenase (NADP+)